MNSGIPGDPGLPPGCSNADIERSAGGNSTDCPDCGGAGEMPESPCCGEKWLKTDEGTFCSKCLTPFESLKCETCEGKGVTDEK